MRPEDWRREQRALIEAPVISEFLWRDLIDVEPSVDGSVKYRPCLVGLRDGSFRDCVYVQEVERWLDYWGVAPAAESGKSEVPFREIVSVRSSPRHLPARGSQTSFPALENPRWADASSCSSPATAAESRATRGTLSISSIYQMESLRTTSWTSDHTNGSRMATALAQPSTRGASTRNEAKNLDARERTTRARVEPADPGLSPRSRRAEPERASG